MFCVVKEFNNQIVLIKDPFSCSCTPPLSVAPAFCPSDFRGHRSFSTRETRRNHPAARYLYSNRESELQSASNEENTSYPVILAFKNQNTLPNSPFNYCTLRNGSLTRSARGTGTGLNTRSPLDRNSFANQSLPANARRHRSSFERIGTIQKAALGGEKDAIGEATADSIANATTKPKPEAELTHISSCTKPKAKSPEGDNNANTNASGTGNYKRMSGVISAPLASDESNPFANASVTRDGGPEPKVPKIMPLNATEPVLPTLPSVPPALARNIDQYDKWTTLDEFGYELKGCNIPLTDFSQIILI